MVDNEMWRIYAFVHSSIFTNQLTKSDMIVFDTMTCSTMFLEGHRTVIASTIAIFSSYSLLPNSQRSLCYKQRVVLFQTLHSLFIQFHGYFAKRTRITKGRSQWHYPFLWRVRRAVCDATDAIARLRSSSHASQVWLVVVVVVVVVVSDGGGIPIIGASSCCCC
jgi:hypothetical protein